MNVVKFSSLCGRSVILLLIMIASATFCAESANGQTAFFMRFEHPNAEELRKNIDESYRKLEKAKSEGDDVLFFQTSIDLGELLTIGGREREAVEVLEPLIKKYDLKRASPEDVAWLYLNYATANQYLRRKAAARAYFKKALKFVGKHKLERVEHYVLHHYARFLVEDRDFGRAEKYFEKALKIRRALNDKRADATREALEKLRQMKAATDLDGKR